MALLALAPVLGLAQNLVPNPSFEEYTQCPETEGEVWKAVGWTTPTWSTDFFHACSPEVWGFSTPNTGFGYQIPHTGEGYGGFYVWGESGFGADDYRELITALFIEPLKKDSLYQVKYYVNLLNEKGWAISNIGAWISDTINWMPLTPDVNYFDVPFYEASPQIVNPPERILSDTANWMEICGIYKAKGGERYITIGNFKRDTSTNAVSVCTTCNDYNTSYYIIDDVSVTKIPRHEVALDMVGDTAVCTSNLPLVLSAQGGYDRYQWSTGDTTAHTDINNEGKYWVRAWHGGCFIEDTITVNVQYPGDLDLPDTAACPLDMPLLLGLPQGFENPLWSGGSGQDVAIFDSPGVYWLQADNACGTEVDTFEVTMADTSQYVLDLGPDSFICKGEGLILEASGLFDEFLWSTGESTQAITAQSPGGYWVEARNGCVLKRDTIHLLLDSLPDIDIYLGPDTANCNEKEITEVIIFPPYALPNYHWSTGEETPSITATMPGVYWLRSEFRCGTLADSIELLGCPPDYEFSVYLPNAFSPNGDGANDVYRVFPNNVEFLRLLIFDRWGNLVFEGKDEGDGWDGTFKGKDAATGVYTCFVEFLTPILRDKRVEKGDINLIR